MNSATQARETHRWPPMLATLTGALASGALIALYAGGGWGWPLGFVALVPWLWTLDRLRSFGAVLASAVLMSALYVAAALGWFGAAFGTYVGIDAWIAIAILLAAAPLLQPQFLAFVLVRHGVGRRQGRMLTALAAAAAWVACEWLFPKLLGDTLGHGLQPSPLLRQAADLGGAAGLTVVLLLVNETASRALSAGRSAWRSIGLAAVLVAALTGYGQWRLSSLQAALSEPAPAMRIGLVQANITDLEHRRAGQGTYAVVREVLDTHFAMSEHAVREQGAEALLWSETIYPTTFGHPKSQDGEAFDREIRDFVAAIGTPLAFGTYDRDDAGEYNSAAFVEPARGLLGHYRKTHLFPFTEWLPAWLDGPGFRRLLPWAGTWQPGDGARVFPLTLADGREANVLPLICLDDVHPQLAIEGARLGAQAILGLSNDAWFTAYPAGARLHLAVATFRSIETRLPQLRVTTNGLSAIIDESGEVVVQTGMGQQAVLVGEIPLRAPVTTLMLHWGDWVGRAALGFLLVLGVIAVTPGVRTGRAKVVSPAPATVDGPIDIVLLPARWRFLTMVLRLIAALTLAWLAWRMPGPDGFQVNSLLQVRGFAFGVALPLVLVWVIRRLHAARAWIEGDAWIFESATQRTEIPCGNIDRLHMRWPVGPGASLQLGLASGRRWPRTIGLADPMVLAARHAATGRAAPWANAWSAGVAECASQRARSGHRWLDHAAIKFLLFPLLPALLAFRLHQHIAFGGTFGELYTYGLAAWFSGLLIWWIAWALGLMLLAAVLRIVIEAATVAVFLLRRSAAPRTRQVLERLARVVYYLGTPTWLVLKLLAG